VSYKNYILFVEVVVTHRKWF